MYYHRLRIYVELCMYKYLFTCSKHSICRCKCNVYLIEVVRKSKKLVKTTARDHDLMIWQVAF